MFSVQIEGNLCSKNSKTTERYKNEKRKRERSRELIYAEAKRWCHAYVACIEKAIIMDGLFLFH